MGGDHRPIRIGTRASRLAMWQAEHTAELLRSTQPPRPVEIVPLSTSGDRNQSDALAAMGGTGVFTREVQAAVLDGRADIAVHSLKDLPTQTADERLTLAGIPPRGPRFDLLVWPTDAVTGDQLPAGVDALPSGATVGTGSPRRVAQLRNHRPDLELSGVRGNVETRLRKLNEGEFDALILADAGLSRLQIEGQPTCRLSPPWLFPAVGQGAIGIECRVDDADVIARLQQITDEQTQAEVTAERSLLRTLQAGCHAPVAVLAEIVDRTLRLTGLVLSLDGTVRIQAAESGDATDAELIGIRLAERLFALGARPLIEAGEQS